MEFHAGMGVSTKTARQVAVIGFLMLISPVRGWPWGCEGHQAVAMIAEKHMTAHALEMAIQLLRSNPIDSALPRFCTGAGADLLVDSSTWADDLRKVRPEAGGWHYIDIPRGAARGPLSQFCPPSGCVVNALAQQLALLRSDATKPRTRADALRFVIHFVADLHQPLHCVDNNDQGGNCVPIDFFAKPPVEKNPQYEIYLPNLHSIWDYGIILHLKGAESEAQWAASLDGQYRAQESTWEKAGVNVDDWVWESHELADTVVYGKLPVSIPVERPVPMTSCADDHHVSTRMLKLDEEIAQPYVDAVGPTIEEQIAKAGVRLALILNQIWR